MPAPNEVSIALESFEMVPIGAQTDVLVGSHHQQCDVLNTEEIGIDSSELPDLIREVGARAEGKGRREHR